MCPVLGFKGILGQMGKVAQISTTGSYKVIFKQVLHLIHVFLESKCKIFICFREYFGEKIGIYFAWLGKKKVFNAFLFRLLGLKNLETS